MRVEAYLSFCLPSYLSRIVLRQKLSNTCPQGGRSPRFPPAIVFRAGDGFRVSFLSALPKLMIPRDGEALLSLFKTSFNVAIPIA